MSEKLNAVDATSAGLVMRPDVGERLNPVGVYHVECVRDGKVIWTDTAYNVVTDTGKNAMMDKFLDLGAAYANVVLGLHTTVGNAASTYTAPSPQVESTVYSNANRPTPTFSAASAGSKATSAAVAFNINGSATVTGCFLAIGTSVVLTKGNTAAGGVLFSSGTFSGGSRGVINGDTLNVTYSLAL